MQRSDAADVQRVRIRANFDEVHDHVTLCTSDPLLRARTPVGGVVQRLGTPAVTSSSVGAFRDKRLGEFSLTSGSSDMHRRVTAIDVVMDLGKQVRLGILSACPDMDRTCCEIVR